MFGIFAVGNVNRLMLSNVSTRLPVVSEVGNYADIIGANTFLPLERLTT